MKCWINLLSSEQSDTSLGTKYAVSESVGDVKLWVIYVYHNISACESAKNNFHI